MNVLKDLLTAVWDALFAPACAYDQHSSGCCEELHGEHEEYEDGDEHDGWKSYSQGCARLNNDGTMFHDGYGVDVMGNAPGCAPLE